MPNTALLEHLATVVRHHIEHNSPLDMKRWWDEDCGCVSGWAAQDRYFRALGLGVVQSRTSYKQNIVVLQRFKLGQPYYLYGFDALERLFELDEYQADYLFGDNPHSQKRDTVKSWYDVLERVYDVIRGDV
jgi:hypothetical protein